MHESVRRLRVDRLAAGLALALAACLMAALPAAAFDSGWTKPKLVFEAGFAPNQALALDRAGKAHIAVQNGGRGVWYVTNVAGSWKKCQLSSGDDRAPSITVANDVVHVAFTRSTPLERGVYTASSDQPAGAGGCGWALTRRHAGGASNASLEASGATLSVAFRSADKKLRFIKGSAADPSWTIREVIDTDCCTSPVELELTTSGAPRVAYGDGTAKKAIGLKYGVRTSSGWRKAKVQGGRIKHVDMTLDKAAGVFNPPPNAPRIIYVVKGKGTYSARKDTSGVSGKWSKYFEKKKYGPPQIHHWSNNTTMVYGGEGKLWHRIVRVITYEQALSTTGRDVKPKLEQGTHLVFSRNKGTTGVYYTRSK